MADIDLSGLSIDELRALEAGLQAVAVAGRVLQASGAEPVFDLTPGQQVRILTGIQVPFGLTTQEPAASPLLPAAAEAPAAVLPDAAGATEQPEPAPEPAPEPVPEPAAEPAPEPVADPVESYLRGLRPSPVWPLKSDLDLIEDACVGLDVATIAIRLEMGAKAVRDRFDLLTNKRAFGREAVRDALRRMCGGATVSP